MIFDFLIMLIQQVDLIGGKKVLFKAKYSARKPIKRTQQSLSDILFPTLSQIWKFGLIYTWEQLVLKSLIQKVLYNKNMSTDIKYLSAPQTEDKLKQNEKNFNQMNQVIQKLKTAQDGFNKKQQKMLDQTQNSNSIYISYISNSFSQKCSYQTLSHQQDQLEKQNQPLRINIGSIKQEQDLKPTQASLLKFDGILDNSIWTISLPSQYDNSLPQTINPQDGVIENKDKELVQLKKQNQQYKYLLTKFELKISQKDVFIDQINVKKEHLMTELAQKQNQIIQLKSSYIILQESTRIDTASQNLNLTEKIQILTDQITKSTDQIKGLKAKIKILELQKEEAQNSIQNLKDMQFKQSEEKKTLNQQNNELEKKFRELKTEIKQRQIKICSLQKESENKVKELQKQYSILKNKNSNEMTKAQDEINSTKKKGEKTEKELTQKFNNLQKQKNGLQDRFNSAQMVKSSLEDKKIKLEKMCHDYEIKIAKLEDTNRQTLKRVEIINEKYKKLKTEHAELESNRLLIEKQRNKLLEETKKYQAYVSEIYFMFFKHSNVRDSYEQIDSLDKMKLQLRKGYKTMRFCPQSLILSEKDKLFLLENLEEFRSKQVLSCKSVYNYDNLNKQNFHKYFDGKDNLLLVIRLENAVIGGFTQYAIEKDNTQKPGRGFIFSVTLQQIYLPKPNVSHPVVKYDEYYLIFGNAEIRIKAKQINLFSNFGIAHCTFDQNKRKKADFLKSNESEIPMLSYEIYQVEFE